MRYLTRALLAGIMGVAVALLAACGGSGGLLSSDQSSALNDQLNSVAAALAAHNCSRAAEAASTLTNSANSLSGIDARLDSAIVSGATTIAVDAQHSCPVSTSTPTTSSSTTASTATTTPPTTTSNTTPSTTTATTPSTTTSETTTTGTGTTTTTSNTGSGGAGLGGGGGQNGSGGGSGDGSGGGGNGGG